MTEMKWQRKDNWVGSQVDDAFVMLDFVGGKYVSLNTTATRIWEALEQPQSEADLVGSLTAVYDVPDAQCSEAVSRLLTALHTKGLVQQVA